MPELVTMETVIAHPQAGDVAIMRGGRVRYRIVYARSTPMVVTRDATNRDGVEWTCELRLDFLAWADLVRFGASAVIRGGE